MSAPRTPASNDLSALPSFGRYEIAFRIAAGGMAEVYGARAVGEAGFKKWVALKRMLPHLTDEERFVEMFLDEARIASNIHSPHVVSTLDLGRASDGSVFLVMDLVIGATLSALIRTAAKAGAQLPTAVTIEIIAQAALGLHDAHEARTAEGVALEIVHRDISPQNILVGVDGRARIMDFGVARATMRETRTRTGEVKGKLSYFSPEQASVAELDRRSDVFSLGVVAWEALTGLRLFHAENPLAILSRLTQMPIPELDALRPDTIPREVAAAVSRALVRDREGRTQSAADFAHELRAAAQAYSLVPRQEDIATAVRAYGGQVIEQIESAIRTVPSGAVSIGAAKATADPSSGIQRTSGDAEPSTVTFSSAEHSIAIEVTQPETAPPKRSSSRLALTLALVLALGAGLVAAALLSGVLSIAPSTPIALEPPATTTPAPEVVSPSAEPVTQQPPTAAPPIEPPAPTAIVDAPSTPPAEERDRPHRGADRRRRPHADETASTTTTATPEPTPERAPERQPDPPAHGHSGLRGVDSFDRSLDP